MTFSYTETSPHPLGWVDIDRFFAPLVALFRTHVILINVPVLSFVCVLVFYELLETLFA